jgi:NAD-reducing hydrogenase small subunit
MSLLDLDERLLDLAERIEIVYSPLADIKEFPTNVDVTFVEGAVTNVENEELAHAIRKNSRLVVSLGDCAVSGNVTALRNTFGVDELIDRAYVELGDGKKIRPNDYASVAKLLESARPLHEIIKVDAFLHGCPPTSDQIWFAVSELLDGRIPQYSNIFLRFG